MNEPERDARSDHQADCPTDDQAGHEPGHQSAQTHWLYRPENWPRLWAVQITLLVLVVVPDLFVHTHGHFPPALFSLDMSPGFFAWYGFIACAAMVAGAKVLGIFLKRDDRYYDD